jgi:hypothetical protein
MANTPGTIEPSTNGGGEHSPSSDGTTPSERYLTQLCRQCSLSLWSHPNLYTDSGKRGNGDGRELCDLLVVFGNDILIFSDKHIQFPDSGDLDVDWKRWFRRAVMKSVDQLHGAESWLRKYPNRIFLDRQCTKPFPLPLPSPEHARYHRIAVTRGTYDACVRYYGGGGTGSLRISTDPQPAMPFTIGRVQPDMPYVHVLDEFTLDVILSELDTIGDLVAYLRKKEELLTQPNRMIVATGEEQLLAIYLTNLNTAGEHDIVLPFDAEKADTIMFDEGFWEDMIRDPQYAAKKKADRESYAWDRLIEQFIKHASPRTIGTEVDVGPSYMERALRIMAAEPRLRRRQLGHALIDAIQKSVGSRLTRLVASNDYPDTVYMFLVLPNKEGLPYDEYRKYRVALLLAYCKVAKLQAPRAKHVVGIAVDSPDPERKGGSEDLIYLDISDWTTANETEARMIQKEFGLMRDENVRLQQGSDKEYPDRKKPESLMMKPAVAPMPVNRAQRRALAAQARKQRRSKK